MAEDLTGPFPEGLRCATTPATDAPLSIQVDEVTGVRRQIPVADLARLLGQRGAA